VTTHLRASLLTGTALALVLFPAGARAQDDDPVPEKGAYALSFALPSGGGTSFSAWKMLGRHNLWGIELDLSISDTDLDANSIQAGGDSTVDDHQITVGPTWKHYFRPQKTVAPFFRTTLGIGRTKMTTEQGQATRKQSSFTVLLRTSIGADWFPVEGISIGGFTGLVFSYIDADASLNAASIDQTTFAVATFRSNLVINFWF